MGRRAIRTPPSSTWEMSSVVCSPPTTARTNGRNRKARSLLTSGPTAWARAASLSAAYHCQKPPRPSGSSRPLVQRARKISSESSRGISVSVACPRRSRVRQLTRRMSSVRGPQYCSKVRRKMATTLSTARSGSAPSSGLIPGQLLISLGSMITVRSATSAGSRSKRSRETSPLGSMRTAPKPCWMALRMTCWRRVDFPVPLLPRMWTCRRRSAGRSATPRAGPWSASPRMKPSSGTTWAGAASRDVSARSAGSALGRWASAASSGTDTRLPRPKSRRASAVAMSPRRRRRSRLRPVCTAKAAARAWALPLSQARASRRGRAAPVATP